MLSSGDLHTSLITLKSNAEKLQIPEEILTLSRKRTDRFNHFIGSGAMDLVNPVKEPKNGTDS